MAESFSMEELLNQYPPKKKVLNEKKKADNYTPPTSGPGRKTLAKMESQKILDIHGMIAFEAEREIHDFIKKCARQGVRRALIIHGKGKHSDGKAVLKPLVRRILQNHRQIADFGSAGKHEGGQGATWIILTISRGK